MITLFVLQVVEALQEKLYDLEQSAADRYAPQLQQLEAPCFGVT
jgi:hypothetical protein